MWNTHGQWKMEIATVFSWAGGSQEGFKSSVTLQLGCVLSVRQMGSALLSLHGNDPGPAIPGEDLAALLAKKRGPFQAAEQD